MTFTFFSLCCILYLEQCISLLCHTYGKSQLKFLKSCINLPSALFNDAQNDVPNFDSRLQIWNPATESHRFSTRVSLIPQPTCCLFLSWCEALWTLQLSHCQPAVSIITNNFRFPLKTFLSSKHRYDLQAIRTATTIMRYTNTHVAYLITFLLKVHAWFSRLVERLQN